MTNATKGGTTGTATAASVRVIGKAGQILRVFLDDGPELQLRQLAEGADLDMSTASRIVASLTAIGVLRFDPVQRLYAPGLMLLELSRLALDRFGLQELIHRELTAMSSEHGWNCYVGVPDQKASGQLYTFDATSVRSEIRNAPELGQRRDATLSSSGLIFLAFGILNRKDALERLDEAESLELTLAKIRREGYAELVKADLIGVAVPIRDAQSQIIATLGIVLDLESFRANQDAIISTVGAKARGLTSAIALAGVTELGTLSRTRPAR